MHAPEQGITQRGEAVSEALSWAVGEGQFAWGVIRQFWRRRDVQFIVHCTVLLGLLGIMRRTFSAPIASGFYEQPVVVWSLLESDLIGLWRGLSRLRPIVPQVLFLVLPTALVLLSRRPVRWENWKAGRGLRLLVVGILLMLSWSGALFDYNIYLNRGHLVDRLLLLGLVGLSWKTPLAVPFATRWVHIMLKESYVPIRLDDFEFRAVTEILIIFSCFVWLSVQRTFKTKHFLLAALGCWASYYYVAGTAKWDFGPSGSWLLENHLSNLSVGAYVRGWLSFIPEGIYLGVNAFIRRFDVALTAFTLVVELGSLVCFFLHPKLSRTWLLLVFLLNFGIFVMSGVCFWKWMFTGLWLWVFVKGRGAPVLRQVCRHWAVIVFAVASVYFSPKKLWYYPQTHVVWYESRFVENYLIYAVGYSGERYLVNPETLTPMDMHWVQGRLCYATDERSITGIYGVTGSYNVMKKLEELKAPKDALRLLSTGRRCTDPKRRRIFDEFFVRYFGNINRYGRPYRWLSWMVRPPHIWVQPQGKLYDVQEGVERIELWRELVLHHGGKLHRLENKKVRTVEIPPVTRNEK